MVNVRCPKIRFRYIYSVLFVIWLFFNDFFNDFIVLLSEITSSYSVGCLTFIRNS